jgi:quinol monooxygenase YgiN
MFQLNLRLRVHPLQAEETVQALRWVTIGAQKERGFISCRIYQEAGNPEVICLEEDWSNEPMLKSHIRSSYFTDLLMLIETAPEPPVLEVRSVNEVGGLDYVEAVRFADS